MGITQELSNIAGPRYSLVLANARAVLCEANRVYFLTDITLRDDDDMLAHLHGCTDAEMPDVIEALILGTLNTDFFDMYMFEPSAVLADKLRDLLYEERVRFDIVNGQVQDLESESIHMEVVRPALLLLSDRQGLDGAESAYQDALTKIAAGKAGDAITDASRALQETLSFLGCTGNSLSGKLQSPRGRELLARHDTKFARILDEAVGWVEADRSKRGDAHETTEADREDAKLTVRIVGSLILRLVERT